MAHSKLWLAALTLCVSCGGSSFESGGNGGASGSSTGGSSTGGTSTGGSTASAGTTGVSGSTSTAGAPSGGAGGAPVGGAGGASAGSGGSIARGGSSGASGSGGAPTCATLTADYEAAADKARGCDSGSTDECSKSSTLPAVGCGCPILVNAKSEFLADAQEKYKALQAAKCNAGPICNIACLAYTDATCSAQMGATGTVFRCTGMQGVTTN